MINDQNDHSLNFKSCVYIGWLIYVAGAILYQVANVADMFDLEEVTESSCFQSQKGLVVSVAVSVQWPSHRSTMLGRTSMTIWWGGLWSLEASLIRRREFLKYFSNTPQHSPFRVCQVLLKYNGQRSSFFPSATSLI